jgi:general secretion pathway protein G
LLAAFVVPTLWGVEEKQKIKLAQATVDSGFNGALKTFRAQMGRWPTSDEGLMVLHDMEALDSDNDEDEANWTRLIEKVEQLNDPWGTPYEYRYPGEVNEDSYDLWSGGPDKDPDTEEDNINNWKEAR